MIGLSRGMLGVQTMAALVWGFGFRAFRVLGLRFFHLDHYTLPLFYIQS